MPVTGELKQWHKTTVSVEGPSLAEEATTFTDYRLDVTFRHESGETVTVPGYFAADGNAVNSNATEGNVWKAHLAAPLTGRWTWEARLVTGENIAAFRDRDGTNIDLGVDGSGSFTIRASDKSGLDARAHGTLGDSDDDGYLDRAGSGEPWLKTGIDSPENFLAYEEFDGTDYTRNGGKTRYEAHRGDFEGGDPTWDGGKGDEIIGAVNWLADQGVNSVYMITMNAGGDGKDVYPWVDADFRNIGSGDRNQTLEEAVARTGGLQAEDFVTYDVSKLDQWGVVFEHMQAKGINLHLLLQEQENDQLLDNGVLGHVDESNLITVERAIYLRELVARFAHNNYLTWNIGEESTKTDAQRIAIFEELNALDPYDHIATVHSFPYEQEEVFTPLLDQDAVGGASLQTEDWNETHDAVLRWVEASKNAGDPWVVTADETSDFRVGTELDAIAPGQNEARSEGLWGALMAGGAGIEYFFGSATGQGDLDTEEFFGRQNIFEQSRIAREFFEDFIPFTEMENRNDLLDRSKTVTDITASGNRKTNLEGYVLAEEDSVYLVYTEDGDENVILDLRGAKGTYEAYWFDPYEGGKFELGTVEVVKGGAVVNFGKAPQGIIDNRKTDGIRGPEDSPIQDEAELIVKDAVLLVKNVTTDLGIDKGDVRGGRLPTADQEPPAPPPPPSSDDDVVDLRGTAAADVFSLTDQSIAISGFARNDAVVVPNPLQDGNGDGVIRTEKDGSINTRNEDGDSATVGIEGAARAAGLRLGGVTDDGDLVYVRTDAGAGQVKAALAAAGVVAAPTPGSSRAARSEDTTVFRPGDGRSAFDALEKTDILVLDEALPDGNGDGVIKTGGDGIFNLRSGDAFSFSSGIGAGLKLATLTSDGDKAIVAYVRADASEADVAAALDGAGLAGPSAGTVRGGNGFDLFDALFEEDLEIEAFGREDALLLPKALPDGNGDGRINTGSDAQFDVGGSDGFDVDISGTGSGVLKLAAVISNGGADAWLYIDAEAADDEAQTAVDAVAELFADDLDLFL